MLHIYPYYFIIIFATEATLQDTDKIQTCAKL